MIVYQASKKDFMKHVTNDEISILIDREYKNKIGRSREREFEAWDNSMLYMFKALSTDKIPDECGVAIEYRIPATSKRVDFILTGLDDEDKENVIIVELKQWSELEEVEDEDAIVRTILNRSKTKTAHPSYQAWSYASLIEDYNDSVEKNNIKLHPCAYLHNYIKKEENEPLLNEVYNEWLHKAPAYTKGDVIKLREFICKYVKRPDQGKGIYYIEGGKIRPSKSLQDTLKVMIDGNEEFIMIDDQKVAFESIMRTVRNCIKSETKKTIIVEGGPGTGKSVLAINLLVKICNMNLNCQYVTKNAAPRNVYCEKLKGNYTQKYINNLFKGSGVYTDTSKNEIDVLIVDEAHRLNAKSGMFKNIGENQIKEIINTAKVSIFFVDNNQRVTMDDIGSIEEIEHHAKILKVKTRKLKLTSQFRCNGSDGYVSWLDDVLEISETGNFDGFEFDFDFKVFDDPNEMRKAIEEKNAINNKSRLVAGYCYEWITKKKENYNNYDIEFPDYDFTMKWNLSNSSTWAIDKESVKECGCIHTCQGLEFDYVGVIIGQDLRFENGKIVTDFFERAKTDKSLNGVKKLYKEDKEKALKISDELIKNTYRILMTRGLKGCYVWCEDKALSNYFKERLNSFSRQIGIKEIEGNEVAVLEKEYV
ncbi:MULTISPECIES: DUF2075 domain-containing protein [Clostridium]|uniref:ATPase AAA n=1 Tax=Clostridium diolis TaxID=223919 RepID=A0AAV3W2H8_9CLOT|nr:MULTISPECIES: DUF2075 domain-containing protein [Clostridium]ALB46001.1 DUF2075 domain-containing protein [Clostridium beijerinckii NRRL B-598]QES73916.1 DUF2075 domain-containing protein [Clostridium diolis]GEA31241.1 ATPase AAA [Clostridium diolis]